MMKKVLWTIATIMIVVVVTLTTGCKKDSVEPSSESIPTYLDTPTMMSATLNGSSIKVVWNSVSGANSYKIYKKAASYNITSYDYINASSSAYSEYYDNSPVHGVYNIYQVQATYVKNGSTIVESEWSNTIECYCPNH